MTVTHQVAGNVQNGYFVKFNKDEGKQDAFLKFKSEN